jgi:hypothetical protein
MAYKDPILATMDSSCILLHASKMSAFVHIGHVLLGSYANAQYSKQSKVYFRKRLLMNMMTIHQIVISLTSHKRT